MQKHSGIVSRCRPGFDSLEERSLLSGGFPGSPGLIQTPATGPPPAFHQEPMQWGSPGSGGAQLFHGGWSPWADESWSSQPAGMSQAQPDSGPSYSIADNPMVLPTFQVQITFGLPPNLGIEKSTVPVAGAVAPPQGKAPASTTEPQPGGTIELNTQDSGSVAGVLVNAGKEAGQETGVVTTGAIGLADLEPACSVPESS